ncbi:MAG: hypothetical protein ACRD1U_06290 [Vicinamibacterales bacterium]
MADQRFLHILERLRASRMADLAGARASATVPVPERLLNEMVAAALPPSAPVQDVAVQVRAGNRLRVSARLTRAAFLPPISLTLEIERQPELPDGPLVLRVGSLPGLVALAGAAFSMASVLPPGLRLEDQRLFVDVRTLLERHGLGEALAYLESMKITTEEGRLIVDVSGSVR